MSYDNMGLSMDGINLLKNEYFSVDNNININHMPININDIQNNNIINNNNINDKNELYNQNYLEQTK